MELLKSIATHPFSWGFSLGLLFFILSFVAHWKTKREYRRFQRHLSDKMELESKQYNTVRAETEILRKENENFRLKIGQLSEKPDAKIQRDVEIMVRAEKRMMISAPGFAAAWETAKAEAAKEVEMEDSGKSVPKRLFTKLFGIGSGASQDTQEADSTALLDAPKSESTKKPEKAGASTDSN